MLRRGWLRLGAGHCRLAQSHRIGWHFGQTDDRTPAPNGTQVPRNQRFTITYPVDCQSSSTPSFLPCTRHALARRDRCEARTGLVKHVFSECASGTRIPFVLCGAGGGTTCGDALTDRPQGDFQLNAIPPTLSHTR